MSDTQQNIIVNSSVDQLHNVRSFVSAAAERAGFSESDVSKITLAVDEACSNVIRHGYGMDSSHQLRVTISKDESRLIIVLDDNGRSYDLRNHSLPDMKSYFDERKRGGLGIKLIRTLMDQVDYEHEGDINKLILSKNLPK